MAYGAFALFGTRVPAAEAGAGLRQGLIWGLVLGGAWTLEIVVANVLTPPAGPPLIWLYGAVYYGLTATGYLLPDLTTYIVSDYLAGTIAHLWIALITGLVFGAAGGVTGKAGISPRT